MRFSDHFLDQIRSRVSISTVVGRAVSWDRRKSNPGKGDHWACCPFHQEKTPSFHADDRKGRYYCFGCKASGDIFRFLIEKHGATFPEAVEQLAREAGLEMPKPDPEAMAREKQKASLNQIMELAAVFFEKTLHTSQGAAARGYLADRRLSADIQNRFRIGYAPGDRHALKNHLAAEGVNTEQMVAAGLVIDGPNIAVSYDRFRDRIMFPICDQRGQVIAFGGRALNPDVPAKYLNSPETDLFHKSAVLYNFHQARQPAYDQSAIIAVEGYMDVIALTRAGINNAVAPLGTALTQQQLHMMWRLAPEPTLCFDGDDAGLAAADRALDTALELLKPGYSLKFALLPAGTDPDDLLNAEGPEALKTVLTTALPLSDLLWQRTLERNDRSTPERQARFEADLEQTIDRIADPKVRDHYRRTMRQRLRDLWYQKPKGHRAQPRKKRATGWQNRSTPSWQNPQGASRELRAAATSPAGRPGEARERQIVIAILNHPALLQTEDETFADLTLQSADLDRLRREILDISATHFGLDSSALKDHLAERGLGNLVQSTLARAKRLNSWFFEADAAHDDALTGFTHMIALHRKTATLERELNEAEAALAINPSDENLMRLNEIREQYQSSAGEEAHIEGFGAASGRDLEG